MAWDPLFDMVKCPVDHVDKVDMQFISDCMVRPAPDPIYDCPEVTIPPDVPPPPVPLVTCPIITCGTSDSSGESMPADITVTMLHPSESATAEVTVLFDCFNTETSLVSEDGSTTCNIALDFLFDFDFKLGIPMPPCPTISAGASTTGGGDATVTVTPGMDNSICTYQFDFDFVIPAPCEPVASVGSVTTTTLSCSEEASAAVFVTLDSTPSICLYTFDFDFFIPEGCPGPPGPPGSDGDKYAIVPYTTHETSHVGLVCVEGPEVRFEDVMVVPIPYDPLTSIPIDPVFLAVCEPGSIQVVSLVPTVPLQVAVGARVEGGYVIIETGQYTDEPGDITLKVSGIRRGRGGVRFPQFTQAEYDKNNRFWSAWNN